MKKQEYLDLQKKHEKELQDFPIAYAFSNEQLDEALTKLGVKSIDECVTVFRHGDIVRREDAEKLLSMLRRQKIELHTKMISDEDFAYEAFLYEMDNHEYAINWTGDEDVLSCFTMKEEDLEHYDLTRAYRLARRQHMKNAREWGVI